MLVSKTMTDFNSYCHHCGWWTCKRSYPSGIRWVAWLTFGAEVQRRGKERNCDNTAFLRSSMIYRVDITMNLLLGRAGYGSRGPGLRDEYSSGWVWVTYHDGIPFSGWQHRWQEIVVLQAGRPDLWNSVVGLLEMKQQRLERTNIVSSTACVLVISRESPSFSLYRNALSVPADHVLASIHKYRCQQTLRSE